MDPIRASLLSEAHRGEVIASTVRAGMFTTFVVVGGTYALTHSLETPLFAMLSARLPFAAPPMLVVVWGWLAFVRRARYRRALGLLSTAFDVGLLSVGSLVLVVSGPSQIAEGVLLGGSPPTFVLFFAIAAAGLRQDPLAPALAGVSGILLHVVVVAAARSRMAEATFPPDLAVFAALPLWTARWMTVTFTAAIVALAARNARRMASDAGQSAVEHARVVGLFGRYVDPEIARDVLQTGQVKADRREVTVLFTDLRDFTTMSEQVTPEVLLTVLNRHFDTIVPVVQKHGGTLNKFIGDAVMATFGAPVRTTDHAARACRAAADMTEAMRCLNDELRREGLPELRMGVGICTGPVVVGALGTDSRSEYAVLGDTVNTASRLEGLNKQHGTEVLLAASTRDALGGAMPTRSVGMTPVKGKAAPVEVFTLDQPLNARPRAANHSQA